MHPVQILVKTARCFVVSLVPHHLPEKYLALGHNTFLPHLLDFITYCYQVIGWAG